MRNQLKRHFGVKRSHQTILNWVYKYSLKVNNFVEKAVKTKKLGYQLEQIQDFTPTPMTLATIVYYAGVHPYTMKPVKTAISYDEKSKQQ